ncbi:MAG: DEAD/DEAH box helicase [Methanomicrobiales archaeon]|nr:DEAD/DEAH box helicase [Methanomicrobiales archaeon]
MGHWLLEVLGENRTQAIKLANQIQIFKEFEDSPVIKDISLIRSTAETLEMVVLDLVTEENTFSDVVKLNEMRSCASDAFRLFRSLPQFDDPLENAINILRASSLAVLGDMGADAARLLREEGWPELPINSEDWGKRTWSTIIDIWLRLIRKEGWQDRDLVLERVASLRNSQEILESQFLKGQDPILAKGIAFELIGLYHLAKAAEVLALYITDGVVDGKYQIHQLLEIHFDRISAICEHSQLLDLEPLARLLTACSRQMADNSIWTVTRSVNSQVRKFVEELVNRGRGNRAIFDVFPPQRQTLYEKGLLGSSRRAIVLSLPTSSGKTLIAQFRILQALNQFDYDEGWVAYIAPTRTLVNQITRRLRRDFEPLNIVVEQVSPALDIDNIEAELLQEKEQKFRVLVTTPEKLDLMLRQGWEEKIGRPLTLVIVDEAHNIQSVNRGLKLELLLATINNECEKAQFLLLTPFIQNSKEISKWLGGINSDDISLSFDWQPNDRIIGIVQAKKGDAINKRSFDYRLEMELVQTTKNTLFIENNLPLDSNKKIAPTYSKVLNQTSLAAVTAQQLSKRGPLIIMHMNPQFVWGLAEKLKIEENLSPFVSEKIKLVQDFLTFEFGSEFSLINLLSYGIGVHHSGLSDDVRALMEWLFECNELKFLVATTTIAQGVNFPITGVVMASHQYPYGIDMPPEDFWNIVGRAGRIDQNNLGIVAMVAQDQERVNSLHEFINKQTGELNSALLTLVRETRGDISNLGQIVYKDPQWSSFVQYIVHSYRQMGRPEHYTNEIEQILRGTLGFEKLRKEDSRLANQLLDGVNNYTRELQNPNLPLKLVDTTGFSLETVKSVLQNIHNQGINPSLVLQNSLFNQDNRILQNLMGVLIKVPELRKNFQEITLNRPNNEENLAVILKEWVNGSSIPEIASRYFMEEGNDSTTAITKCGTVLYGKLTQTAAWGLGAIFAMLGGNLDDEQKRDLNNFPSQVYYGVNETPALTLRLLGIPRAAAIPLSHTIEDSLDQPIHSVRNFIRNMDEEIWSTSLGKERGGIYKKVWEILEGI